VAKERRSDPLPGEPPVAAVLPTAQDVDADDGTRVGAKHRHGDATEHPAEGGFTFVELMVVLLVMAILIGVAIPTFLGVSGGAKDRAAQTNLMNAFVSAKALYGANSSFPSSISSDLASQEPELQFTSGPVPTSGISNTVSVSVTPGGGGELLLVAFSPTGANGGTCLSIASWDGSGLAMTNGPNAGGTWYSAWREGDVSSCSASSVPPDAVWSTRFPPSWTS
jgi:prepilin-type N-terminal cleavage/methylation domain-containing protein